MNLPRLAVQYLEDSPRGENVRAVRARLRTALTLLPIDAVLLGWNLSPRLEEGVAAETLRHNIPLYRWQPLLTGDRCNRPPSEWRTTGPDGNPVAAHSGLAEFTFVCPNRQEVREWTLERLETIANSGLYQGIFLDRIRFPSPTINPTRDLACFCPACTHLAAEVGLDLENVRHALYAYTKDTDGVQALARFLLAAPSQDKRDDDLQAFLVFRQQSIIRFVQFAAQTARAHHLLIGLDCFSPSLTTLVGQELSALDAHCDWIKIMTYPRVFGPAGLAFELLALAKWLIENKIPEKKALQTLNEGSGLPIPLTLRALASNGLSSESMAQEIQCGRAKGIRRLLAGLALVTIPSVHSSSPVQLNADIQAARQADGLVLSWDLWHILFPTLTMVEKALSPQEA